MAREYEDARSLARWGAALARGQISRRQLIQRALVAGISMASVSATLASCSREGGGGGAGGGPKVSKLGFSHPFPGTDIYRPLRKGLREEASKLGVQILESQAEGKADLQINEIRTWIESGVQAIAVLNIAGEGLKPLVELAHSKGVKMLGYGSHLEGEDAYTVFDNEQGAEQVAAEAEKWINQNIPTGEVPIGLLTLDVLEVGKVRVHHALDTLKQRVPRVKVVGSAEGTNIAGPAQEATRSMIQAHPEIRVMICISDDGQVGAYQALKAVGKEKDVWLAGYDGSRVAMNMLLDREMIGCTAAIPLKEIGASVIWAPYNLITGKTPTTFDAPYKLVTNDTPDLARQLIADFE